MKSLNNITAKWLSPQQVLSLLYNFLVVEETTGDFYLKKTKKKRSGQKR